MQTSVPSKRARQQANRREKCRKLLVSSAGAETSEQYIRQKYIQPATPIRAKIDIKKSNVVSTGYTGRDDGVRSRAHIWLEDLLSGAYGGRFKVQEWDGRYSAGATICLRTLTLLCSYAIPITDIKERVIVILARKPQDNGWPGSRVRKL